MNQSELYDFLPNMINDERTLLVKISDMEKSVMIFIIAFSCLWCTLMKTLIYWNVSKQTLFKKSINILILSDQVIHHIAINIVASVQLAKVILRSLAVKFGPYGHSFCGGDEMLVAHL